MSQLSELWHRIFGTKKAPDETISHPVGGRVAIQAKEIGVGVLLAPPKGVGNAVSIRRKVSGELELEFLDTTGKAVAGGLNFAPGGQIQLRFTTSDGRKVTLTGDQLDAAVNLPEVMP